MKKRSRRSLILLSAAAISLASPAALVHADETEAAAEQEAESAEEEEKDSEENAEEGADGESAAEETIPAEPPVDYYIQVTAQEGLQIHQLASETSPLSISISVPSGSLLHITGEETDPAGDVWGYTSYADLKGGYIKLSTGTAKVSISSAREEAERMREEGPWGHQFVKVDGAGTPITFNNVSKDKMDAAEAANQSKAAKKRGSASESEAAEETGEEASVETDENGNVIEKDSNEDTVQITNSDGSSATASSKSGGWFSILSYALGSVTIILLEAVVAGLLIVSKKVRIRKKPAGEGDEDSGDSGKKAKKPKKKGKGADGGDEGEDGGKKKKKKKFGFKPPKIKLPFGKKKKKKKGDEDAEDDK